MTERIREELNGSDVSPFNLSVIMSKIISQKTTGARPEKTHVRMIKYDTTPLKYVLNRWYYQIQVSSGFNQVNFMDFETLWIFFSAWMFSYGFCCLFDTMTDLNVNMNKLRPNKLAAVTGCKVPRFWKQLAREVFRGRVYPPEYVVYIHPKSFIDITLTPQEFDVTHNGLEAGFLDPALLVYGIYFQPDVGGKLFNLFHRDVNLEGPTTREALPICKGTIHYSVNESTRTQAREVSNPELNTAWNEIQKMEDNALRAQSMAAYFNLPPTITVSESKLTHEEFIQEAKERQEELQKWSLIIETHSFDDMMAPILTARSERRKREAGPVKLPVELKAKIESNGQDYMLHAFSGSEAELYQSCQMIRPLVITTANELNQGVIYNSRDPYPLDLQFFGNTNTTLPAFQVDITWFSELTLKYFRGTVERDYTFFDYLNFLLADWGEKMRDCEWPSLSTTVNPAPQELAFTSSRQKQRRAREAKPTKVEKVQIAAAQIAGYVETPLEPKPRTTQGAKKKAAKAKAEPA
eukprot:GHVU01172217.1.p1 GENE.GHVU01172217.1~~GHVU01172217.1.p1  ORF type:complete len:522 (+),score=39.96 GHVU01172217.1:208-1773(+)